MAPTTMTAEEALSLLLESGATLQHWGVKGMKWGVRKADASGGGKGTHRYQSEDGTVTKGKYPAGASRDHITAHEIGLKPLHEMSNNEISTFTKRLGMEKSYRDAVNSLKPPTKRAKIDKALGSAFKHGKSAMEIYAIYNKSINQAKKP